jgi:hypothetical protein
MNDSREVLESIKFLAINSIVTVDSEIVEEIGKILWGFNVEYRTVDFPVEGKTNIVLKNGVYGEG